MYPNGKSWDEIPGRMSSGKKFFHNAISGADFAAQPYYVAIVTSFIRCDIGGLEIDEDSEILGSGSQAIRGLQGTCGAREEPGFLCFVLAFSTTESLNWCLVDCYWKFVTWSSLAVTVSSWTTPSSLAVKNAMCTEASYSYTTSFIAVGDWGYNEWCHGNVRPGCQRVVAKMMKGPHGEFVESFVHDRGRQVDARCSESAVGGQC